MLPTNRIQWNPPMNAMMILHQMRGSLSNWQSRSTKDCHCDFQIQPHWAAPHCDDLSLFKT
jgi:hypothetical protein